MNTTGHIRPPFKEHHDKHENDHNEYGSKEAEANQNIGEDLSHDVL